MGFGLIRVEVNHLDALPIAVQTLRIANGCVAHQKKAEAQRQLPREREVILTDRNRVLNQIGS